MDNNASRVNRIPISPTKNMRTAGLLCFFLGGFGAHRLYVDKKLSGVFQIGLCVGGWFFLIFGTVEVYTALAVIGALSAIAWFIWVLVDFVTIVSGNFLDMEGRVVRNAPATESAPASPPPRPQSQPQQPTQSSDASRLQQRILMCAKRDGGAVVPATVAMRTGFDIDVVKEHLESLIDKGHAELQPSKDGTILYVFPDMLTDERRNELELI